ncbi:MAG: hypothetical protein DRP99_01405, partial [Candidatus Latescibacterota bacterium]
MKEVTIDARGLHYKALNEMVHRAIEEGAGRIILENVAGQRYIGDGLKEEVEIVIRGTPGNDLAAFMDGPRIFVRGDVGYRVGIHMKAYKDLFPVVVVGGRAKDFLGEYMAGGLLVVLGLDCGDELVGDFVGTGMHGG